MWEKQVLLAVIGLSSGIVVSGGLFSFIASLGVISDLADRTHTGEYVRVYEDAVVFGGVLGNVVFLYQTHIWGGEFVLAIVGLLGGIFVGCQIMALAEVLNVFPIFVRRIKIVKYVPYLVLSIALGKAVGELIFAFFRW